MFGDLMDNMREQQNAIQEKLKSVRIIEKSANGSIHLECDGNGSLQNVNINNALLDPTRKEELEDLLVVHLNELLAKAKQEEASATQSLMEQMMPPGMGDITSMFGK